MVAFIVVFFLVCFSHHVSAYEPGFDRTVASVIKFSFGLFLLNYAVSPESALVRFTEMASPWQISACFGFGWNAINFLEFVGDGWDGDEQRSRQFVARRERVQVRGLWHRRGGFRVSGLRLLL